MLRDVTLITVMQQTSLFTLLYFRLITSILLNMVAIMLDLSWCTVELLSLKPLTAWAVQDC